MDSINFTSASNLLSQGGKGGMETSATCLCPLEPRININITHILNKPVLFLVQNMKLFYRWK